MTFAVFARARAEVHEVIGHPNRLFVVLDDEHRVPETPKFAQHGEQPTVVPLMEANRRLVEHVKHARQLRPDLGGEANALAFPARECRRASRQREVAHADVDQKVQPVANLADHPAGDPELPLGELDRPARAQRRDANVQPDIASSAASTRTARLGPQPPSQAGHGCRLRNGSSDS